MKALQNPIPENEFERLLQLSDFDFDYTDLDKQFKDLTKLAAKVAGTEISLINLIDSFTQWSVSAHGFPTMQIPREDSVCQYTIMGNEDFEIKDLSKDERFLDKFFVKDDPNLRYYFGVPLTTPEGNNLGALCVLDTEVKSLSQEKVELLRIIADEIVNRFKILKAVQDLKGKMNEIKENQKKVAHDIRGPIGGIIGLAKVIQDQGNKNQLDEVLEFINLIQRSGSSVLELADEILSQDYSKAESNKVQINHAVEFSLETLKEKLLDMYSVQAVQKNVKFTVTNNDGKDQVPFPKNKLLQIVGNLVSNAIKFTPDEGAVNVALDLQENETDKELIIIVNDTGVGMSVEKIDEILNGNANSTLGTGGEKGFGFGLTLVKHLIDKINGSISIDSDQNQGTKFTVRLPV
ncbi:GAF domain-containing sensor histidine kinase [Belliella aquatica]|uniref:histidine kinase n=1 Tax=Belliella aquatica TaxID=1323734 RepID=A0ABQ1MYA6_9BACT|nr:GAF domain-containing sensor histidine kinase [Belliella aquatica]MCH7406718.1 GAF domain-containing sensor histidine kinase [Belliella aquatica]GGC49049.1 sensor histidine kinase [Belliella aquatica]